MSTTSLKTRVLIIGAGVTGTGLARDLSLRGIRSVLVEQSDFNAGASGGNHGLLHSGARYVATDPASARECWIESRRLKKLAAHCIDDSGGLFVAVQGDDENYIADFPRLCAECGIETKALDVREALEMEPVLSNRLTAAYRVADASIDPFKLAIENISHARQAGARFLPNTRAVAFHCRGHRIRNVRLVDCISGRQSSIEADLVVNAAGAWSGEVARLGGVRLSMIYSKGSLLVTQRRIARRVVNRLRMPTDGDILVPGGTVEQPLKEFNRWIAFNLRWLKWT